MLSRLRFLRRDCIYRARRLLRFVVRDPKLKMTKNLEAVKIKDVKCGAQHTIAVDDQGRYEIEETRTIISAVIMAFNDVVRYCPLWILALKITITYPPPSPFSSQSIHLGLRGLRAVGSRIAGR